MTRSIDITAEKFPRVISVKINRVDKVVSLEPLGLHRSEQEARNFLTGYQRKTILDQNKHHMETGHAYARALVIRLLSQVPASKDWKAIPDTPGAFTPEIEKEFNGLGLVTYKNSIWFESTLAAALKNYSKADLGEFAPSELVNLGWEKVKGTSEFKTLTENSHTESLPEEAKLRKPESLKKLEPGLSETEVIVSPVWEDGVSKYVIVEEPSGYSRYDLSSSYSGGDIMINGKRVTPGQGFVAPAQEVTQNGVYEGVGAQSTPVLRKNPTQKLSGAVIQVLGEDGKVSVGKDFYWTTESLEDFKNNPTSLELAEELLRQEIYCAVINKRTLGGTVRHALADWVRNIPGKVQWTKNGSKEYVLFFTPECSDQEFKFPGGYLELCEEVTNIVLTVV